MSNKLTLEKHRRFHRAPEAETLQTISCTVCGSNAVKPHWRGVDFHYKLCRDCSMVYQNPQPEMKDLENRYDETYFDYEIENEENFFNLMMLGLKDIRFDRIEKRFPDSPGMMDIGCATGRLLSHFKDKGYRTQGVEICEESATYGIQQRDLNIFIGPLEESKFEPESFDFIHSSHVIEHVPDPTLMVKKIYEYLKPGGVAVLVTPNIGGMQAKLTKEKWRSSIGDHIWLFNKRTLRRLLKREGFKIKKVKTWGGLAVHMPVPRWFKRFVDKSAKRFGFGDVMLFYVEKS